jgi:hypothetical protein
MVGVKNSSIGNGHISTFPQNSYQDTVSLKRKLESIASKFSMGMGSAAAKESTEARTAKNANIVQLRHKIIYTGNIRGAFMNTFTIFGMAC